MMVSVLEGQLTRTWYFEARKKKHVINLYHDTLTGVRSAMVDFQEVKGSMGNSSLLMESRGHRIFFTVDDIPGYLEIKKSGWAGFTYSCVINDQVINESTEVVAREQHDVFETNIVETTFTKDELSDHPIAWYLIKTVRIKDDVTTSVHRRFREFVDLNTQVKQNFKGHHLRNSLPPLPEKPLKSMTDHRDPLFIKDRANKLERYIAMLISVPHVSNMVCVRAFLGIMEQVKEFSVAFHLPTLGLSLLPCEKAGDFTPAVVGMVQKPEKCGPVLPGDAISKINGFPVAGSTFTGIVTRIKYLPRPIIVHFIQIFTNVSNNINPTNSPHESALRIMNRNAPQAPIPTKISDEEDFTEQEEDSFMRGVDEPLNTSRKKSTQKNEETYDEVDLDEPTSKGNNPLSLEEPLQNPAVFDSKPTGSSSESPAGKSPQPPSTADKLRESLFRADLWEDPIVVTPPPAVMEPTVEAENPSDSVETEEESNAVTHSVEPQMEEVKPSESVQPSSEGVESLELAPKAAEVLKESDALIEVQLVEEASNVENKKDEDSTLQLKEVSMEEVSLEETPKKASVEAVPIAVEKETNTVVEPVKNTLETKEKSKTPLFTDEPAPVQKKKSLWEEDPLTLSSKSSTKSPKNVKTEVASTPLSAPLPIPKPTVVKPSPTVSKSKEDKLEPVYLSAPGKRPVVKNVVEEPQEPLVAEKVEEKKTAVEEVVPVPLGWDDPMEERSSIGATAGEEGGVISAESTTRVEQEVEEAKPAAVETVIVGWD